VVDELSQILAPDAPLTFEKSRVDAKYAGKLTIAKIRSTLTPSAGPPTRL